MPGSNFGDVRYEYEKALRNSASYFNILDKCEQAAKKYKPMTSFLLSDFSDVDLLNQVLGLLKQDGFDVSYEKQLNGDMVLVLGGWANYEEKAND